MHALSRLAPDVRQYLLVTGNYWAFTLTDGALRMLVVLHFHALGYTPLQIAGLFLFYEIFGVVTNLLGGYLGARIQPGEGPDERRREYHVADQAKPGQENAHLTRLTPLAGLTGRTADE